MNYIVGRNFSDTYLIIIYYILYELYSKQIYDFWFGIRYEMINRMALEIVTKFPGQKKKKKK